MEIAPLGNPLPPARPLAAARAELAPEPSPDRVVWQPLAREPRSPAPQAPPASARSAPAPPVSFANPAPPVSFANPAPPVAFPTRPSLAVDHEGDLTNLLAGAETSPELWLTATSEALAALKNGWIPSAGVAEKLAEGVLADLARVCAGIQARPQGQGLETMLEMQSRASQSMPHDFFSRAATQAFEHGGPGRLPLSEEMSHWLVLAFGPDRLVQELEQRIGAGPLEPCSETAVLALRSYLPNHLDEGLEKRFFRAMHPLLTQPAKSEDLEKVLRGYRNRVQNEGRWHLEKAPPAEKIALLREVVSVSKVSASKPADAKTAAAVAQALQGPGELPEVSVQRVGEGEGKDCLESTLALIQQALPREHRKAGYEAMAGLLSGHKDVFVAWNAFLDALDGTDPLAGLAEARLGMAPQAQKSSGVALSQGAVNVGGVRLRTRNRP